jgi:hypothetical protein
MTLIEELAITPDEQVPDVEADKPTYECPQCGIAAKSPAGLASHRRHCKDPVRIEVLPKGTTVPTTPKQKRPALPTGKRQDASAVLGFIYGTAANFVPSMPAQRAMAWQSPSAGRVLDDAVAGTFLDKVIVQKLAGANSKIEPLANLFLLPVCCFLIDQKPSMSTMLYPLVRRAMEGNLHSILRQMKIDQDDRALLEAEATAVGMEWETTVLDPEGKPVKLDVIDSILSKIFAPPVEAEPAHAASP